MAKLIRTLFGLRPVSAGSNSPAQGAPNPYHTWLAAEIQAIRQCESVPGLIAYLDSGNGYLREAAIARSVELASPELLPALTGRLNDWVREVRHAAKRAVFTLVPHMPADVLVARLPTIHQLLAAGRDDHSEWVRHFENHLLAVIGPAPVLEGIRSNRIRIARACFHMARTHGLLPVEQLVRVSAAGADIRVAGEAVEMIAGLPETARHALYLAALGSSFGAIRTTALRALLALPDDGRDGRDALAQSCLFDAQSSVRLVAGAYLRQRGIDVAAIYIERLRSQEADAYHIRTGLLALAAGGQAEHARFMEAYATSPLPRVQMAALMGWVRLEPAQKDRIVVLALESTVPRIRKLSLVLIRDFGAYVPVTKALALAETRQDYRLMLRLARQESWTWLETIVRIECIPGAPEKLKPLLSENLLAWIQSSSSVYAAPTPDQIDFFRAPATRKAIEALLPAATSLHKQIDYTIAQTEPMRRR